MVQTEKNTVPMPAKKKESFAVPVIIVGSHYDLIPPESKQDTITRVQSLVNEMTIKYADLRFLHSIGMPGQWLYKKPKSTNPRQCLEHYLGCLFCFSRIKKGSAI